MRYGCLIRESKVRSYWPVQIFTLATALGCADTVVAAPVPVDFHWEPIALSAQVGEMVEVRLFVSTRGESTQEFAILEAVLQWDADLARLVEVRSPCTSTPCPSGTYRWLKMGFPVPSPEGLNDSLEDGDALLWAIGQLRSQLPVATPEGLWVATLRFQAIGSGLAKLRFVDRIGIAETKIVTLAGEIATGSLGAPADLTFVRCLTPTVAALGSRYLLLTPADQPETVALSVSGVSFEDSVGCLSLWVQPAGTLARDRVYQTPAQWGVVALTGWPIVPDALYKIRTDCTASHGFPVTSTSQMVRTWPWGDVNHDGDVLIDDITSVIDGTQGILPPGVVWECLDLMPCTPDGIVDELDVAAVQDAFDGLPFPCLDPCDRESGLATLRLLVMCMADPGNVSDECVSVDFDNSGRVDLADFAVFQWTFGMNGAER